MLVIASFCASATANTVLRAACTHSGPAQRSRVVSHLPACQPLHAPCRSSTLCLHACFVTVQSLVTTMRAQPTACAKADDSCVLISGSAGPGPLSKDALEKHRIAQRQEAHTRYDPPVTPLDQLPHLNAAHSAQQTSPVRAVDALRAQTCAERERYQVCKQATTRRH